MERKRFESGDPTLDGATQDFLVSLRPCSRSLSAPVYGEQQDFCFLIRSFLIQRRRLANGGDTAMSTANL
jgi:hypothetical protein